MYHLMHVQLKHTRLREEGLKQHCFAGTKSMPIRSAHQQGFVGLPTRVRVLHSLLVKREPTRGLAGDTRDDPRDEGPMRAPGPAQVSGAMQGQFSASVAFRSNTRASHKTCRRLHRSVRQMLPRRFLQAIAMLRVNSLLPALKEPATRL